MGCRWPHFQGKAAKGKSDRTTMVFQRENSLDSAEMQMWAICLENEEWDPEQSCSRPDAR
jgi:hypothetical protein